MQRHVPSKYQKYLLGVALVLSSIAISIRSIDGEVKLILHEYPGLIFLLMIASSILVAFYFHLNRMHASKLLHQIRQSSKESNEGINSLLNELTARQREVYDLIVAGKTNKEIMSELFIEKSTLKSHINQIYKKININSRSELKSKSKG